MNERIAIPETVALVYRIVGDTHVFHSKGIKGLVHVGSHDRAKAFTKVMDALNHHVTEVYGCEAVYKCSMTYEQFAANVDSDGFSARFLSVTLDHAA